MIITTTFSFESSTLTINRHSLPPYHTVFHSIWSPRQLCIVRATQKLHIGLHFSLSRLMIATEGVGALFMGEDFRRESSFKVVLSKYTTSHRSSQFLEIGSIRKSSAVADLYHLNYFSAITLRIVTI